MKNWTTLAADVDLIMSRNYTPGRNGAKIEFVVVHHNAGALSAQAIYELWMTQRSASAHYQVDIKGTVSQHVNDWDTAWHAGDQWANERSIGIEHANGSGESGPLTAATLDNGAHLVAAICIQYGLGRPQWMSNVFPHKNFYSTACPGPIADAQRAEYMTRAQSYYDRMTGATKNSASDAVQTTPTTEGNSTMAELTYDQVKDAARNGAASVSYGANLTWGSGFPVIYAAAKDATPEIQAGVKTLLAQVAKVNASQDTQNAAIAALSKALSDLAAAVATADANDEIDVQGMIDQVSTAVTAAGEAAVERTEAVLREALDGATLTLDTVDKPAPEPTPQAS